MRIHSFMHILAMYKGWGVEVRGIVPTSTIYSTTIHSANVPFFDLVPVVPPTKLKEEWNGMEYISLRKTVPKVAGLCKEESYGSKCESIHPSTI